jgi:eukaryotic-like serine/threonine-protein kinase
MQGEVGALLGLALAGALVALALVAWRAWARRTPHEREKPELPPYQLREKLGEGSMATVYRALHTRLARPTAIKIARQGLPPDLFVREVRLHASLNHPNTAIVHDFGEWSDGQLYCAIEFIDGLDLGALVQRSGPQSPGRVIRILTQIASSLAEAHGKRFVHQDIKPQNIMLTERGGMRDFVKVLDFGLARTQERDFMANQSSGGSGSIRFVGTPGFAAPEIATGAAGSPSSDIFSLGAVGYFLLAGKGPFEDQRFGPLLSLPLARRARLLESSGAPELAFLIAQCLSREPIDRPLSMNALGECLRKMQGSVTPWTPADAESWWAEYETRSLTPKSPREQPAT